VQTDELELSIDRAVPLGLILNEAATNSLKHAFGPDAGGRISVKLVAGVGYGEGHINCLNMLPKIEINAALKDAV
jgi:two-component sensor histidine kinase